MRKYRICKSYVSPYANPINLIKGNVVRLGHEETDERWKGWIWAENDLNKGWIPKQIIEFSDDKQSGKILNDYSAKELNISENEYVLIRQSLNGWSWVQNLSTLEEGWIPDEIIDR